MGTVGCENELMNNRILKIAGCLVVLLLVAVALLISRRTEAPAALGDRADAEMPGLRETSSRPSREAEVNPATKSRLNHEDVISMKPAQWKQRFEDRHHDVPVAIRNEIVMLSDELGKELESGLDPQSEDAKAYSVVMLTLLTEEAIETSHQ